MGKHRRSRSHRRRKGRATVPIAVLLIFLHAGTADASHTILEMRKDSLTKRNRERKRNSNPGESLETESYNSDYRVSSQQIMDDSLEITQEPIDDVLVNFRFNKFSCMDGIDSSRHDGLTPLDAASFPIAGEITQMLQRDTNAISVVDSTEDHGIKRSIDELVDLVGGPPLHPSAGKGKYWVYLEEVISARMLDKEAPASEVLASKLPLPDRWENYTVHEVAKAVHDEYPGLHQANFLEDLLAGKYGPIEIDSDVVPKRCNSDFLRSAVMLATMNTWSIGCIGPYNFAAKWWAGRARPEEVVWAIKTKSLRDGVPRRIRRMIKSLNITNPEEFTAYPEGCPRHPSWPAMHSAASNLSFWLQVVLNTTFEQSCQARIVDNAVAYARTVAGVHFPDDNVAGLNMGQVVMADMLPEYLHQMYGSDQDAVKRKIEAVLNIATSWDNFDPKNPCA